MLTKQLKQPWGVVTTTPAVTSGGKQPGFATQYCGAASTTVLSGKRRLFAARGPTQLLVLYYGAASGYYC